MKHYFIRLLKPAGFELLLPSDNHVFYKRFHVYRYLTLFDVRNLNLKLGWQKIN